ncbi:MAG: scyllo-inositol 2-dehydrogenase [Anaerolineae bacterium]
MGRHHSEVLARFVPAASLTVAVDPDEAALHRLADDYGYEHRFRSLEQAIESADFDAVIITVPTGLHEQVAVTAASAGKHIFLEKPMALTLEQCDAIIEAANEHGVCLQLGFMRRFQPEFVEAARRIEAGEIGQVMMVKSLTHGPGLPPPWARDLRTSNGLLAEVNSHDWDCIRWLAGSNYQRVYTEVANFKGQRLGVTEEHFYDTALVNVRFESGALGSIAGVCPAEYGYDARVEIIGEKGILQIGRLEGVPVVVGVQRDQGVITPVHRTWGERFAWGYIYELQHFVECARTGAPPRVTGEDGRWAVAGVLAATRSMLEGRPVDIAEVL